MFIRLNHNKGQSTLEYAVLIAIIVGALVAMQVYIKRGLQGRWRQATDDIGEQFSPGITTGHIGTNSTVASFEETFPGNIDDGGGATTSSYTSTVSHQFQHRDVNETVQEFDNEWWPEDQGTSSAQPIGPAMGD